MLKDFSPSLSLFYGGKRRVKNMHTIGIEHFGTCLHFREGKMGIGWVVGYVKSTSSSGTIEGNVCSFWSVRLLQSFCSPWRQTILAVSWDGLDSKDYVLGWRFDKLGRKCWVLNQQVEFKAEDAFIVLTLCSPEDDVVDWRFYDRDRKGGATGWWVV